MSCARGPGTSRVPEPAPLQVRSRRGLRAPLRAPSRRLGRRRRSKLVHRVRSLSDRCLRVTAKAWVSFELGRACLLTLLAWAGVANRRCIQSTSALRTIRLEHSVLRLLPAQRPRGLSPSEACASCSPAQRRLRAAPPSPELSLVETGGRAPTGSEPVDANEARGIRVSRRDYPLRRVVRSARWRFLPPRSSNDHTSDTPVASSAVRRS